MLDDNLFSIGKAAKLSGVSTKTLRYYETLNLIQPKKVSEENGYRYYDKETLLLIPVIKYYRQVGFSLKEMKELTSLPLWSNHYTHLLKRRNEINYKRQELLDSLVSTTDWIELIREGEMCLQNREDQAISMKYYPEEQNYCYLTQPYNYNFKESIVNLEWVCYLEEKKLEITGPVILKFCSYIEKINGTSKFSTILQHCLQTNSELEAEFGGFMALSSYHIGPLEQIDETYQKIVAYAETHKYSIGKECYERYVIDYWATQRCDDFVTEVIIPIVAKDGMVCKN